MNEQFLLPVVNDNGIKESVERGNSFNRMFEDIYLGAVQVESFDAIPNYPFRKVLLIRASKIKLGNVVEPKEVPYLHLLPVADKVGYQNNELEIIYKAWFRYYVIADVDNKIWN